MIRPIFLATLSAMSPLVKKLPWKFVFGVNVGSQQEAKAFAPDWAFSTLKKTGFLPGGIIKTDKGFGLVVGTFHFNEEIKESSPIAQKILNSVSTYNANKIALTGVVPGALMKHGIFPEHDHRFVTGTIGTLFMLKHNLLELIQKLPPNEKPKVAVVGYGYTGKALVHEIEKLNDIEVKIFDNDTTIKPTSNSKFYGDDFEKITDCQIVILLTVRGDEGVSSIIDYLLPGTLLLSDTHPKISRKTWALLNSLSIDGYESAATITGFKAFPSYPGWNDSTIPGCLIQAFIESQLNQQIHDQEQFDSACLEYGVKARLDKPYERTKKKKAPFKMPFISNLLS